MKKNRAIYSILAILLGVFMIVYGGIDDSPGGQMIGLALAVVGVVVLVKNKKRN